MTNTQRHQIESFASVEDLLESFDTPQKAGAFFEDIVTPFLLKNLYRFRVSGELLWRWKTWPGRRGLRSSAEDLGVDWVAQINGETWAIQAKYRSTRNPTLRDLATCLNLPTSRFDHLLIITNRPDVSARFREQAHRRRHDFQTHYFLRKDFVDAGTVLDWNAMLEPARPARLPRKSPIEGIQDVAIRSICHYFHLNNTNPDSRATIVMPCGTGKTLTALWIAEHLNVSRCIYFAPNLTLLRQTIWSWEEQSQKKVPAVVVCSDPTTGQSVGGSDWFQESPEDLGIPVTTNVEDLSTRLSGDGPLRVFATYQSAQTIAGALSHLKHPVPFDLMVLDEAHRTVGLEHGQFATPLDQDQIPAVRRLCMTATPRITGQHIRAAAEEESISVYSMDDPTIYGPHVYSLTFREAIAAGLISDYKVLIAAISETDGNAIADAIRRRGPVETTSERLQLDARTIARRISCIKLLTRAGAQRVLSFHSTVADAESFASDSASSGIANLARAAGLGNVAGFHIAGHMRSARREDVLSDFDATAETLPVVLTNARCLLEGIDLPTLDGVAFMAPKRSTIDIIQATGRALRKAPGKEFGLILVPVVVPDVSDSDGIDSLIETSEYERIYAVIRALRDQDERLAATLNHMRAALVHGRGDDSLFNDRFEVIDLGSPIPIERLARAITVRTVEQATASFWEGFGHFQAFVVEHGHPRVAPFSHNRDGFDLGMWSAAQRRANALGELSDERYDKLDALHFVWDDNVEDDWDRGLDELLAVRNAHGHVHVWRQYVTPMGFMLGEWCEMQRNRHQLANRQAADNKLTTEQAEKLVALGFEWDSEEAAWQVGLRAFQEYCEGSHPAKMPRRFIREWDRFPLRQWYDEIRWKATAGKLSASQVKTLTDMGFTW